MQGIFKRKVNRNGSQGWKIYSKGKRMHINEINCLLYARCGVRARSDPINWALEEATAAALTTCIGTVSLVEPVVGACASGHNDSGCHSGSTAAPAGLLPTASRHGRLDALPAPAAAAAVAAGGQQHSSRHRKRFLAAHTLKGRVTAAAPCLMPLMAWAPDSSTSGCMNQTCCKSCSTGCRFSCGSVGRSTPPSLLSAPLNAFASRSS